MFKSTGLLLTLVMICLAVIVFQSRDVIAEPPHKKIIKKLDSLQETLDYEVIPKLDECCGYIGVPKTGQTFSYAAGDDGDLEKGIPWPNPRFTDNGDGTVTDNLTCLIWLKNANQFGTKLWAAALNECNSLKDDGTELTDGSQAGDWRLPNIRELHSLIHFGYDAPALPDSAGTAKWTEGNPFSNVQGTDETGFHWSSTSLTVKWGWAVHFKNGDLGTGSFTIRGDKSQDYYNVWCVRGAR